MPTTNMMLHTLLNPNFLFSLSLVCETDSFLYFLFCQNQAIERNRTASRSNFQGDQSLTTTTTPFLAFVLY